MKKIYLMIEWSGSEEGAKQALKEFSSLFLRALSREDACAKIYDPETKRIFEVDSFLSAERLDHNRLFLVRFVVDQVIMQSWTMEIEVGDEINLLGVLDYQEAGASLVAEDVVEILAAFPDLKVSIPGH